MTAEAAPPRRRLTSTAREQQLLDVAEELFTQHGYEGVSIEDIARAAGVSRPIIYQHYGSKEGIFIGCVRRARAALEERLTALHDTSDLLESVQVGGRIFFEMVQEDRRRWNLLFTSSASLDGGLADDLALLRYGTITQIADNASPFAVGVPRAQMEAFAYAVSGIGEQLDRWWMRQPEYSIDDVVELYVVAVTGAAKAMLAHFSDGRTTN